VRNESAVISDLRSFKKRKWLTGQIWSCSILREANRKACTRKNSNKK
jgi:hypothetical protein